MQLTIEIDLHNGKGKRTMRTNMLSTVEWEKTENRRLQDGKGFGYSDLCCMAYVLCKLAGDKVPGTWREWVAEHPDMEINAVQEVADDTPTTEELGAEA